MSQLDEPNNEEKIKVQKQLKSLLIATMLDKRLSNMFDATDYCLHTLLELHEPSDSNSEEKHQYYLNTTTLLYNEYTLQYLYELILALCDTLRVAHNEQNERTHQSIVFAESMLQAALRSLSKMAETEAGLQAMHKFFTNRNAEDEKNCGSLVELMLCFTGTSMSLAYVREHLQFIEKLFQEAEKFNLEFPLQDLRGCFVDLAQVDKMRLKAWLTHIIYSNSLTEQRVESSENGTIANTTEIDKLAQEAASCSTPSSNAQTPTNMATVSAMPSLTSEQQSAGNNNAATNEPDAAGGSGGASGVAMEIDDEGLVVVNVPAQTSANEHVGNAQAQQQTASNNNNVWPTGSSYVTNHSEPTTPEQPDVVMQNERNGGLLLRLIKLIVGDGEMLLDVCKHLFQVLLQLGQSFIVPPHETPDFPELLQIMILFADMTAQTGGHATLFKATMDWLDTAEFQLVERVVLTYETGKSRTNGYILPATTLENISALLRYFSELLQSLGYKGSKMYTPPWDDDILLPMDGELNELMGNTGEDGVDVMNGDDDAHAQFGEDDEESLNNKLCTFSQTQKEFMNQHWYHCHTCNMVNTVGVCSICARVCHKGHDVSYAKYGNFFCDCGAKEDGSCQALTRRNPIIAPTGATTTSSGSIVGTTSGLLMGQQRLSNPTHLLAQQICSTSYERLVQFAKLLENCREQLQQTDQWSMIIHCILDFFDVLMPAIRENCALYSIVGCHKRAKDALARLHNTEQLTFNWTDKLLLPTLGSQEGAFENVRMSYAGDQGQTIKQLLNSGLVRRVALCCLTAPQGKRQHLAVSHEKNKVTILQLSTLLKQADAAKRKLTLTQLAAAPIPCTVLSLAANPANEDCLAVCGLKECHILTFSSSGATNEHLVLTPQLENGNFIKKALWLPGAQTLLALVTADYVKIYDLAEDAYSPKYYFLLALGKIRDCTFVYQSDGSYYMLLIASSGYIYYQILDEQSLAKHGDFYVTNTFELNHPQIKDVSGQVGSGGVSIYYSHTLQLLFFSYAIGRSFVAALTDVNKGVGSINMLQLTSKHNSSKQMPQALCQWSEVAGHPGLVCAMLQTSNNPVIFMFTPERISIQEIKAQSTKARIMDMVAIRHSVAGVEKTTLILLCEDGSLRIFTAQLEHTNFWLSSQVQPLGNQLFGGSLLGKSNLCGGKKSKRKSANANALSQQQKTATLPGGQPIFPIDYFEHCTLMPDVEFGGNDLLQIYNKQKLKTRLVSAGMFVVSTKISGFTLEIINNDPNTAIVGIRVLLGTQNVLRAPQNVTILGRIIPTTVRHARWFDIPLTREEILQSDKILKVFFDTSQDPEHICMLDSIEVYGKSKELLCWPDDSDEAVNGNVGAAGQVNAGANGNDVTAVQNANALQTNGEPRLNGNTPLSEMQLNKMLSNLLEVLDCGLQLLGGAQVGAEIKQRATKTATTLLLLPTAAQVQLQTRYVLATLFGNRTSYHNYKDLEVLQYVHQELQEMQPKLSSKESLADIDPEHFYRLVLLVRSIATARPISLAKICNEKQFDIVVQLKNCMEQLYLITPRIDEPTSIVRRGLCHTEMIVHALVETIYAFALNDGSQVHEMTKFMIDLLKHESSAISHSAKEALSFLLGPRIKRRKVAILTPPTCATPTPTAAHNQEESVGESGAGLAVNAAPPPPPPPPPPVPVAGNGNNVEFVDVGAMEQQLLNMDALMGLPQLLGLQQDADEEAIMDIAIALSLQQHEGDALQSLQQGLANLRQASLPGALDGNVGGNVAHAASLSQAGSDDDEVSNVATDGSTMRTSPAEAAGSGGSESGGSGVESIGGQSGRSSTYGDPANSSPPRSTGGRCEQAGSSKSSVSGLTGAASTVNSSEDCTATNTGVVAQTSNTNCDMGEDMESEDVNLNKLHDLRLAILHSIQQNIPTFDNCNGIQALALIQVILMLTTDLNSNNERDQKALNELITALVEYVETSNANTAAQMKERNSKNEVRLALLCLFGVLMGKTKSKQTAGTTSPPHQFKDNASFVASTTANILSNNGAFGFSMVVMESLLQHWKRISLEQCNATANNSMLAATPSGSSNASGGSAATQNNNNNTQNVTPNQHQLMKVTRGGPKPDVSTLIPHNYLKNYPDIFENYDALLTETCVRLPYQILRLTSMHAGSFDGYNNFCETMTYTLCVLIVL